MKNDLRVNTIYDLIITGLRRADILKYVAEKTDWGISSRQVDRLVRSAYGVLDREAAPIRLRELKKCLRRLDQLYSRSMQITDFKTCLAVEKTRIELLDLDGRKSGPMGKTAEALKNAGSWRWKLRQQQEAETKKDGLEQFKLG